MGSHNPFVGGGLPVNTLTLGGAMPSGDDGGGASAILGGVTDSLPKSGSGTPGITAGLVIMAAGIILGIHFLGVRTHFTVSAGR